MYPILYLDAIVVKVRTDGRAMNRPVNIAMAVDLDGYKHVLGLWLGDGDEGAKYWLGGLSELANRGAWVAGEASFEGYRMTPDGLQLFGTLQVPAEGCTRPADVAAHTYVLAAEGSELTAGMPTTAPELGRVEVPC